MSLALWESALDLGNLILASANVIIGFSLFVYILTHNWRSPVARAFCALIAFVTVVYVVDVSMSEVTSPEAANIWLRLQWIGIAFVPAAYFHFSHALLHTITTRSHWRPIGVLASYLLGLLSLAAVAFTDWIVGGIAQMDHIYHLLPGKYFGFFATYYVATSIGGWTNITRARQACVTSTSRRRMSYLMLAFVAPSLGVFPYLLIPATGHVFSPVTISMLTLVGNMGIALMTIVIAYIVAYQGVLLPDRVIKHRLVHFLLRGPLVAIVVIALMLSIPRVEHILGVPRDTILIVTVAGSVVLLQVLINLAKPAFDRLIYRRDREEVTWIQSLDERLLTTTDLKQLLENTVVALCELFDAPSGFIVTMQDTKLSIRVFCGSKEPAKAFLAQVRLPELLHRLDASRQKDSISATDFVLADGHWLLPLRARKNHGTLGILGIRANAEHLTCTQEQLAIAEDLVQRAETALEDMRLQQQVFKIIRGLDVELGEIQQWRSSMLYLSESALQRMEANPANLPGFTDLVKDALRQFWGGPKLSKSPLARMRIVRKRMAENDYVPAKAIRAVLREAIERLRPDGDRDLNSSEWVLYNILDLRYVQGFKIKDIARRLLMSESDYYRKQRIAIDQVAETLIRMEQAELQRD